MTPGKDFWVDRNTMTFVIENSDPDTTYRIIIYLNKIKLDEELMNNMHRASGDQSVAKAKATIRKRGDETMEGYDERFQAKDDDFFTRPDYRPKNI